jgi:hypothetical protein
LFFDDPFGGLCRLVFPFFLSLKKNLPTRAVALQERFFHRPDECLAGVNSVRKRREGEKNVFFLFKDA